MTMMVRPAVLGDYAAVERLAREIHAQHVAARPDYFQMSEPVLSEAYFRDLVSGDASIIFIAEERGIIEGYAICLVRQSLPLDLFVPRTSVIMDTLVVTETRRGHGIGRELVDACLRWAKSHGATTLELSVWEFNTAAIAFYERLGMKIMTRRMSLPLD